LLTYGELTQRQQNGVKLEAKPYFEVLVSSNQGNEEPIEKYLNIIVMRMLKFNVFKA
jgi:hypothetical protein